MTEKQKSFVYDYWNKTERGRMMIASGSVSESDLLFMIPNNVKRMHGLPVTRTYGKRKSIIKKNRKRFISSFVLFDLISEIIERTFPKTYNDEFIDTFVDVKNINIGDKYDFKPDIRFDTNIRMAEAPTISFKSLL